MQVGRLICSSLLAHQMRWKEEKERENITWAIMKMKGIQNDTYTMSLNQPYMNLMSMCNTHTTRMCEMRKRGIKNVGM